MANYKLILDGHTLEVEASELAAISIPFNKKYEALNRPTDYFTDYSRTVNIPFTRRNNEVFSRIFRTDQVVTNMTIDPRKKIDFILLLNEELYMTGYAKVTNVYNNVKNKYYQLNLFSKLGELLGELKQYTFDPKADVEAKYKIANPLTPRLALNRHLVKRSFEQESHNIDINSKSDLDYFGFLASYQGKYPDFSSDKVETFPGRIDDLPFGEQDEHYMRNFRSYYQQPYVYIDALWQLVKKQLETTTDYKMNLDKSWFNNRNPYYSDVIYTCPTLYEQQKENEANIKKENYLMQLYQYKKHITQRSDLSNHHRELIRLRHDTGSRIYNEDTDRFNSSDNYPINFNEKVVWWLMAGTNEWYTIQNWCKIRKDNPVYIRWSAIDATTNREIPGANYTIMLYSSATNVTTGFDDSYDVGVTNRNRPNVVTLPENYDRTDGFFWSGEADVHMTVNSNNPFYIVTDFYTANNGAPFEAAISNIVPRWDWLWDDLFFTTSAVDKQNGITVWTRATNIKAEQTQNIRSNSELTMNRIWSKDVNIFDVLMQYSKMFHLVFDLDEDGKTLNVMSRNRFFENYKIVDWTDKVDRNKDYIVKPLSFDKKWIEFNYNEGKGQRHTYYQDKYEMIFGAKKVDTGYDFGTDSEKLFDNIVPSMICSKKQDSRFFNTHVETSPNFKGYNYKYLPQEYFVENDNEGSNAGMSGAFYFHNGCYDIDPVLSGSNVDANPVLVITDDTEYQIKKSAYCWSFDANTTVLTTKLPAVSTFSKDGKYSIQFEDPKETYYNADAVLNDNATPVYKGFWKKYLDERYCVQNKVLTCYLYLSPKEYKDYKFNQFVVIDNVLYLPNQIYDFDAVNRQSTKVELMQVTDIDAYTHSHINFPYLYADCELSPVVTLSERLIDIYSTSEWHIQSVPDWMSCVKLDGKISVRAYGATPVVRRGDVVLTNDEGLYCFLHFHQDAADPYLRVNKNNLKFQKTGGSQTIGVMSFPDAVTVISKPDWIDVNMLYLGNSGSTLSMSGVNVSVMISVDQRMSVNSRTGDVVLTNGFVRQTIRVTQLGGNTITRDDDDILILRDGFERDLGFDTSREIRPNSFTATKGTVWNTTNDVVGRMTLTFRPSLPEGRTADGGQVTFQTLDGKTVLWNYNIGTVARSHTVRIDGQGNGKISGQNVIYGDYTEGSVINVEAVGNNGQTFTQWSDGSTQNPRTITVNRDIDIYALFGGEVQKKYITYDNGDILYTDNLDKIIL